MKSLIESIEENAELFIYPFEDYSNTLQYDNGIYKYLNCNNRAVIYEGTFNRLLSQMHNNDFVIITAYRANFTKKENILRNRKLRGILNSHKMGVHQLVGHWQEAPSGVDYKDAKKSDLIDSVERSYMVVKHNSMSDNEFKNIIMSCMTIDNETQDAVLYKHNDSYFLLYNNGTEEEIGSKLTLNKISQAYSQYVKKMDIPFVFEGVETPVTNIGKQIFNKHNILY